MSIIVAKDLDAGYGGPLLVNKAGFAVEKGERLALMGRNGCGKTTFLNVLRGRLEPLGGELNFQKGLKISSLEQEVPASLEGSIFDVILKGAGPAGEKLSEFLRLSASHEHTEEETQTLHSLTEEIDSAGGWKIQTQAEAAASKLELPLQSSFYSLSAGMKRKVLLARVLAGSPDLILLDEPTNHLDIDSIRKVEELLLSSQATLLFITHDRAFLRKLATRIFELDRGFLRSFECSYDEYLARKRQLLDAEQAHQKQFDKKLAEEEVWIRRGIQGRRTRNEGRVRELQKMREMRRERTSPEGSAKLNLQQAEASGMLVSDLKNVSFSYDGKTNIVTDFTAKFFRGDRIGIAGENGVGKSTLLKLILGELEPSSGRVRRGTNQKVAYFDQLHNKLDYDKTLVENVADGFMNINFGGTSRNAVGYLKDFLFPSYRAKSLVSALSGGERTRLLLAKLFAKPSNILVLDEPTNNLDIETIELLEEQLAQYQGTIFIVSHDRAFLNNVVTSTLVFEGGGKVREYVGGYDDYIREKLNAAKAVRPEKKPAKQQKKSSEKPRRLSYHEKKELEKLPEQIETLEEKLSGLHSDLADPDFYKSTPEQIAKSNTRLKDLEKQLEEKYDRWQTLEQIKEGKV
ncbi:ABC transporter ATP-binding protein uup [Sedimentisphaera cyanobacteriorum]|uniref:ATP-binding protein Uup n=1 Tax=Sedimentisphaera cyanobacteriorum TaxID=1940790 RepID=A0A1Q2HQY5_9BACT|nr:ATP-binding cassette domain-containing protein [Sedimentisphaera cyanobacteriorum]AQQ09653.1 ABC transporter ATP-binding protein uup [Sedimentisphaera cyanobacteriorum]